VGADGHNCGDLDMGLFDRLMQPQSAPRRNLMDTQMVRRPSEERVLLDKFYPPDYSKLKRGQFRQDTPQMREYAANVPVDVGRGTFAGLFGLASDTLNFVPAYSPMPMEQFGDYNYAPSQKVPYGSEYFLESLPLAPAADNPLGRVAGQLGSFAPIVPVQAARIAGKGAAATGRFVAPKAGQLAEGYMQRMGMMPGIVPAEGGLLTPSIKPQAPVSDLGFYSAAEQAALNLQRNKGTGQSFINDLMKAPDVKKEELAWTGLDEFLANKPNVTKQEVQDYLAGNRVDLQEVRMGEAFTEDPVGVSKRLAIFDRYEPEIQALYKEMDNPSYVLVDRQVNPGEYQRGVILQNRVFRGEPVTAQEMAELEDITNRFKGKTVKEFPNDNEARSFYLGMSQDERLRHSIMPKRNATQLQTRINEIQDLRDAEANAAYVIPEPIPTKYKKWQLPGGENYREILLTLPFKEPAMPKGYQVTPMQYDDGTIKYFAETPTSRSQGFRTQEEAQEQLLKTANNLKGFRENLESYQSSHFNEPNVLAHMRVNDRIDADGKKMLLIEELQSDWHQAGREKGYKTPQLEKALKEYETLVIRNANGQKLTPQEMARVKELQPLVSGKSGGVPDAPFKDTWHQLALKRALKYAADNGYERVGLTTGAQQADRFNLSKQVDEVIAKRNPDGSFNLDATLVGGGAQQSIGKNISADKLADYVGKDLAKSMQAQSAGTDVYSGDALKVGGEGMKKYYDEIYPAFLAKQGKKFNAKTGETRIKTGQGIPGGAPVRYIDISPEMKSGVSKGQPMFAAAPIAGVGLGAGQQQQPADILTNELDYPSNPMYTDPLGYSIR